MVKISVIMPVYNTEKGYLTEAIESILNQTFQDFEFLIIDDGSTEPHVKETILSYNDDRIKYFYKDNSGVADTLNFGLSKASGEYIARMDADDISLPERFEKQASFLDCHPDISLVGSWIEFFPDKKVWKTMKQPKLFDFLKGTQLAHPTVMFRHDDFKKYDFKYNPEYPAEDYELWTRVISVLKVDNIQEVLLKYRVSEKQVTASKACRIASSNNKIQQKLLNFLTSDIFEQQKLLNLGSPCKRKVKFLGIPVAKIKSTASQTKIYLFGKIPLLKINADNVSPFSSALLEDDLILQELLPMQNFSYMPNSGNIGDMLIATATMDWFDKNNLKWHRTTEDEFPENFVYGGGGAWLKEWIGYLNHVMDKMKRAKKVVILPSSFNEVPELISILDERFVVFCREKKSYDYLMSQNTKAKIILNHDMAFRLSGKFKKNLTPPTKNLKKMSKVLDEKVATLPQNVRFFRKDSEAVGNKQTDLDLSDTLGWFSPYEDKKNIDFASNTMLKVISKFEKVETDRLHVGIASALLGKEVYLHDNSYGKVSGVFNQTLHVIPNVQLKK
ncbi:MAG: glycosyltransferase [Alphaproteobacteria bacterium]|nr:glycosyltransferase [Alphaproteobacteria bacterium]